MRSLGRVDGWLVISWRLGEQSRAVTQYRILIHITRCGLSGGVQIGFVTELPVRTVSSNPFIIEHGCHTSRSAMRRPVHFRARRLRLPRHGRDKLVECGRCGVPPPPDFRRRESDPWVADTFEPPSCDGGVAHGVRRG